MRLNIDVHDEDRDQPGAEGKPWSASLTITEDDGSREVFDAGLGATAAEAIKNMQIPGGPEIQETTPFLDPLMAALADALEDRAVVSEENGDQDEAQAFREAAEKLLDPWYADRVGDRLIDPFIEQIPSKI